MNKEIVPACLIFDADGTTTPRAITDYNGRVDKAFCYSGRQVGMGSVALCGSCGGESSTLRGTPRACNVQPISRGALPPNEISDN